MEGIFLQDEQIFLRAPEPEDLEVMYEIENNTSLWDVTSVNVPYSRYDLKQYILNSRNDLFADKQLRLMIIHKDKQLVIGMIDLSDFDPLNNRAAVGIIILEDYRGGGVGKRALSLLMEYCFKYLYLNQLYAYIPSYNINSLKLFNSCGFSTAGTLKSWIRTSQGYKDVALVQCINIAD